MFTIPNLCSLWGHIETPNSDCLCTDFLCKIMTTLQDYLNFARLWQSAAPSKGTYFNQSIFIFSEQNQIFWKKSYICCLGHTGWAPEGREGWSQAGLIWDIKSLAAPPPYQQPVRTADWEPEYINTDCHIVIIVNINIIPNFKIHIYL